MDEILHDILDQPGFLLYLIVGFLVFAEDVVFLGFVIPGETAAIIGGVAASQGNVSLTVMCVVVVVAAIVGDSVGYELGSRYGGRLLSLPLLRRRKDRFDAARDSLARHGGAAVFIGRFIGFVRPVVPFLAGTSHMSYRRFLGYNVAGGVPWGAGSVLIGYVAGQSYRMVARTFGHASAGIVVGLILVGIVVWIIRRRRRRRRTGGREQAGRHGQNGGRETDQNGGQNGGQNGDRDCGRNGGRTDRRGRGEPG
jgi:membrane protein DedA with SNARE-associated domain